MNNIALRTSALPHARALCALPLLLALSSAQASGARPAASDKEISGVAQQQLKDCTPGEPTEAPADGWRAAGVKCAWKGLIVMRRWTSAAAPSVSACVGPAARWWSWMQRRLERDPAAPSAAWHSTWTQQVLSGRSQGRHRLAFIERGPDRTWTATELTWTPSARSATRTWQSARWIQLEMLAAQRASQLQVAGDTEWRHVGESILRGRAGELSDSGLTWQSGTSCVKLAARVPGEQAFPLPFAREDARLEQRAAMQVQLSRRYPEATMLTFFTLLDLPSSAGTAGGAYEAIWAQQKTVVGQLWMPTKDHGRVRRFRLLAGLPDNYDSPGGRAAATQVKKAIDLELRAIAALPLPPQ